MRARLSLLVVWIALATGCTRDRTQVMLGVLTNLFAPGELSQVRLSITRNQVPVQDRKWSIPGTLRGDYQLPGSVGIFSEDGEPIDIAVTLSGFRGPDNDPLNGAPMTEIVRRESQFTLVPGQTLFARMALAVNCVSTLEPGAPRGCAAGQTCVEGRCVQALVDSARFLPYAPGMERAVQCRSGREARDYHDTETADVNIPLGQRPKLPLSGSGQCQRDQECIEGTCYKLGSAAPLDLSAASDGGAPTGDGASFDLPAASDDLVAVPSGDLATPIVGADMSIFVPGADMLNQTLLDLTAVAPGQDLALGALDLFKAGADR